MLTFIADIDEEPGPKHTTKRTSKELRNPDCVLTAYKTLRSDWAEMQAADTAFSHAHLQTFTGHYPLLQVHWKAVIFDEARKVCNADTATAKAAHSLRTLFRLLMTGTPLQNEYSDLLSLARLMEIPAFSDTRGFEQVWFLTTNNWKHAAVDMFSSFCCHHSQTRPRMRPFQVT
jgi:SNF2 family DNA or RNA helicase